MPDIVAHNALGDKVLARLPEEVAQSIDRDIFRFSIMGPDPYIFYRFFAPHFRHGVNQRSHTMHRTKTAEFLMELAKHSQSMEMFSFLAGFLCHFALDSTTHPYIYGTAEYRSDMHTAIEHRLDVLELERQGKERRELMKLFSSFPDLPEARDAMKTVYGWDDDCFRTGYRHMKLYHWIVKDQHGLLNALCGRAKGDRKAISYRNHLCDGMDLSPFDALADQAVDFGTELVTAAYEYRAGKISGEELRSMIGSRNYAGEIVES